MIRKAVAAAVVLCAGSAGRAALSFVGEDVVGDGGTTGTFYVHSDTDGSYMCWLEFSDQPDAIAIERSFTDAGNPNGDSVLTYWPEYGHWYEVLVASLDPDDPIKAGDHLAVDVKILWDDASTTQVNLYEEDGATFLDRRWIIRVPEPGTGALLLALGGLVILQRQRLTRRSIGPRASESRLGCPLARNQ